MSHLSSVSERPTLPPLHTLDLPRGGFLNNEFNDTHEHQTSSLSISSKRQCSTSSSTTSSSRTPSPSPSSSTASSRSSPSDELKIRVRLVPSTLETADAVVIVPPPDASYIPSLHSLSPLSTISSVSLLPNTMDENERARALLLLGPALQHFRHPQRQIAKGARVHPYKIIKAYRRRKVNNLVEICV